MKCACGERIDGNINRLAYLDGADNRIGHSDDDLYGVGFRQSECGNARSDERAELYSFLHDLPVKGGNQRGVAQSDVGLAGQGPSGLQLLLACVKLCASRVEIGFRNALAVV